MSETSMRFTRKCHRNMLRATNAGDTDWMRHELYTLYDPTSTPLKHLVEGPSPMCLTPMVDAALLASYKANPVAAELRDNLQSVAPAFRMQRAELKHVLSALDLATEARTNPAAMTQMAHELALGGFGAGSGMCMPQAMMQQHHA